MSLYPYIPIFMTIQNTLKPTLASARLESNAHKNNAGMELL
jgi:hypothetical protein